VGYFLIGLRQKKRQLGCRTPQAPASEDGRYNYTNKMIIC
jgi:hypothetical protein